jgi:signal transduction histidine kinase
MAPSVGDREFAWGSLAISGLGVAFFVFYLVYVSLKESYLRGPEWLLPLGLILMAALSLGLGYGGYWVADTGFPDRDAWRVVIWVFAGLIGALSLTFWPIFYQRIVGVGVEHPEFILLVSSGFGANAGVVAGVYQIRSERQYERAQEARDSLRFVNRLLRHNVLNAVTIIRGNASELCKSPGLEEAADRARTILGQSDRISDLVGNTRILIREMEGTADYEPVDVTAVTADVLDTARETYDRAVIESDLPDELLVGADPLLSAVIDNLVTNAIEHSDRETPRVEVTVEARDGSAAIRIADDGPGLPEETTVDLIDPGMHGDEGLGLYLVDMLVSRYGGELRLGENQPRGTVATVTVPLTDAGAG